MKILLLGVAVLLAALVLRKWYIRNILRKLINCGDNYSEITVIKIRNGKIWCVVRVYDGSYDYWVKFYLLPKEEDKFYCGQKLRIVAKNYNVFTGYMQTYQVDVI